MSKIQLKIRPRWQRVLRWPLNFIRHYRIARTYGSRLHSARIGARFANLTVKL